MLSWFPQIDASLRAWLGPNWRNEVRLWDADWTYVPHIDGGVPGWGGAFDGTQYTDHCLNLNLDCSLMQPSFYSQPKPNPQPASSYVHYSQQNLTTPWGSSKRQEYAWIWNYDWARPYYGKSSWWNHEVINLQIKLRWWAGQLTYRIQHDSYAHNAALWRYSRLREANNRVKGKVCTPSYSTCNN
jgi:hypothetical protein